VTAADIEQAYVSYYVPSNMSIVIVGHFDEQVILKHIEQTFGQLPRAPRLPSLPKPPYPTATLHTSGTLAPLLDAGGTVGIAYRTEGLNTPDLYALWVLQTYFERVLYEKLRVAAGLSYNPQASYNAEIDYGIFAASADTELDKLDIVHGMIDSEFQELRQRPPGKVEIETAKRNILLLRVQGYESNASVADYYAHNLHELAAYGRLTDHEAAIAALTSVDIKRVVDKYLRRDRQVVFRSSPTLSYSELYAVLAFFLLLLAGACVYVSWRFHRHRRLRVPRHANQR
jgi:zinc protease